jgi:hypothetical protein
LVTVSRNAGHNRSEQLHWCSSAEDGPVRLFDSTIAPVT